MVKQMLDSRALDRVFHALADSTRRRIIEQLAREPASISALAQPFEMSLAAILQHVQVLEESGLVRTEKSGRVRMCRIDPKVLSAAEQWFGKRRAFWERNLDRLDELLRQPIQRKGKHP